MMDEMEQRPLDALADKFASAAEEVKKLRKQIHEQLMTTLEQELHKNIGNHPNLKSWQFPTVGSGGGYAAIHPKGGKEGGGTGANSMGAITNYLNEGFRSYAGRNHTKPYTFPGWYFYDKTESSIVPIAEKVVSAWREKLEKDIEKEVGK